MRRISYPVVVFSLVAALLFKPEDAVGKGVSFIRDAEIENTIRAFAAPLFTAAGLDPSAIRIFLINDKSLNAFVAGGQKLFINTGLLMRTENPGQVIGVIAHETGHIVGGHLSRTQAELENATARNILSYILGGAAAIATGRGDIGQAIILGGQQVGQRLLLKYSRTQEAAADQSALRLIEASGMSARGLLEFLDILGDQELLSVERQDPYVRTHPLSRERISQLRDHLSRSPYTDRPFSADFVERHRRMRAKLHAFMEPVPVTLRRYPEDDTSLEARYARAIAYFRRPDLSRALPLIDGLIAERPQDPFFLELKGQMLFENGRPAEALGFYRKAVELMPNSALLRRELARVQLETDDPSLLEPAIANLRATLYLDFDSPFTWRQLAIAYGRQGRMGLSALAMAEEAMLNGNRPDAVRYAERAEKLLPQGSSGWLQAQDILSAADGMKQK